MAINPSCYTVLPLHVGGTRLANFTHKIPAYENYLHSPSCGRIHHRFTVIANSDWVPRPRPSRARILTTVWRRALGPGVAVNWLVCGENCTQSGSGLVTKANTCPSSIASGSVHVFISPTRSCWPSSGVHIGASLTGAMFRTSVASADLPWLSMTLYRSVSFPL